MTEKRFEINNDMNLNSKVETYELSCIVDNSNKTFYFIVDSIANVESFVERLNKLHEENQRLTDKLNQTALELVDGVISQGKAVEISEMSYSEFLDYRAKKWETYGVTIMTEKDVVEYLQTYHNGDVSELKKELYTEKRFTIEIDDENIAHILDNGTDIGQYNLCKLLNELAEEKEYYQIKSGQCEEELLQLRRNNEQLKRELAIYRKIASCSNCNYHDYDWYDDGDEFEVCNKGNDVTEGICKEWEELE